MFACGSICFSDDLSLNLMVVEETDLILFKFLEMAISVCTAISKGVYPVSIRHLCNE